MLFTEYDLWSQDGIDMFEFSDIPETLYASAISVGNKYINCDWGVMTASMYTDARHSEYAALSRNRRIALSNLAVAEHIERKGRYLEDIINGIWCICEESTWLAPDSSCSLRDVEHPRFRTEAASTASLLMLCVHLFRRDLPLSVKKRVEYETQKRVFAPCFDAAEISRIGAAHVLTATVFSEQSEDERRKIIDKTLYLLDNYLDEKEIISDTDEENVYTQLAYIFDILEILYNATDQKFSVYSDERIKKCALRIYKAHLGSDGFSESSTEKDGARIFLFGKRMDYKKLMDFGASEFIKIEDKTLPHTVNLFHKLYSVKYASEILQYGDNFDEHECGYIDSMELFVKKTKGFSAAVKGGTSSAGNFLLYLDNEPYVVDLEKSHNLPIINGFTQFPDTHKAVTEHLDNGLMLDLTKTYPKEAGIVSWMRSIEAEEKFVIITDDYELSKNDDLRIVLLMKNKPILSGDRILADNAAIVWDGNMALRVELVKSKNFDYVYRLIFHIKDTDLKGQIRIALKKIN